MTTMVCHLLANYVPARTVTEDSHRSLLRPTGVGPGIPTGMSGIVDNTVQLSYRAHVRAMASFMAGLFSRPDCVRREAAARAVPVRTPGEGSSGSKGSEGGGSSGTSTVINTMILITVITMIFVLLTSLFLPSGDRNRRPGPPTGARSGIMSGIPRSATSVRSSLPISGRSIAANDASANGTFMVPRLVNGGIRTMANDRT